LRRKRADCPKGQNREDNRRSSEFESLREYVDGGESRKLNWTAATRRGKLIVNQCQAEKNQPVFMLVNAGRPTRCIDKGWKKLDCSISAAQMLADTVSHQRDCCGLIIFDSSVKSVIRGEPPQKHFMKTGIIEINPQFHLHLHGARLSKRISFIGCPSVST
jgi:uncharacterized protein (DUF58 family)